MERAYRKRPVVIEAVKWEGTNWEEMNEFIQPRGLWWLKDGSLVSNVNPVQPLVIRTLEGNHEAQVGDWIIKGIRGEYYPCKPEIFQATYELASDGVRPVMRSLPSDGELWSAIRTLLTQGEAIYQDFKYKPYEEYSARVDVAARERIDWLKTKLNERDNDV